MKLEVALPDSLAKWLSEQASQSGLDIETCCLSILEEHVRRDDDRLEAPGEGSPAELPKRKINE